VILYDFKVSVYHTGLQRESFMEHPRLNLGMIGFTAAQRKTLTSMLLTNQRKSNGVSALAHHPVWQLVDYRESDALVLNAAHSKTGPDKILRFHSDPDHPSPVGVTLSELSVPFAMAHIDSLDAGLSQANELHVVDIEDYRSVLQALQYFEATLRPLRTLYALAKQLMTRGADLDDRHVYHLSMRPNAMEVLLDLPQRRVWVREATRPIDLDYCNWQQRPASANDVSEDFAPWTMEELAWIYARHCKQFHLPERYMDHLIYARSRLRVRASLLYPRHLELLEQISRKPWFCHELAETPSINRYQLERDLYALYLCRAITTDPRKVRSAENPRFQSSTLPFEHSSSLQPNSQAPAQPPTVPMGLPTSPAELV
jgi:hypothetical protein